MSGSLNKVQIIGNLGKDPEIRYTADNSPIANITVATAEKWKDKSGKQNEKTEWHRIVMFGKLAEIADKYLHKGSSVYFEGKLQTRKWQDKSGIEKYTTEIVVDAFSGKMVMLGNKESGKLAQQTTATRAPVPEAPAFDDDVPF